MSIIPEMPAGATHLEFTSKKAIIVATVDAIGDFRDLNGVVRFGRFHKSSDRFESMMPGDLSPVAKEFAGNDPLPVQIQSEEHRTMKSSEESPKEAEKAPKAKYSAPPKASQPKVKAPKGEGSIAQIWKACEAYFDHKGDVPSKEEIGKLLPALNLGTINTQISAWRRHRGLAKRKA